MRTPWVRDRLQPGVADRLAVDARHVRRLVIHDEVGGRLVLRLVGDGAEGVAQGVEAQPATTVEVERPDLPNSASTSAHVSL